MVSLSNPPPSPRWKLALLLGVSILPPAVALAAGGGLTALPFALLASLGLAWPLAERLLVGPLTETRALARINEQALRHSTDVLRSIVSALPVGVVAIDRNVRVEIWNHAAETILGYPAAEMVGHPAPTTVFQPTADEANGTAAADVFLRMVTGQMVKGEEVLCRRKDGRTVEASFSGAPLMDSDDRILGAICVFEDIGHRKTMARQLHQSQKMEAVGQLTGGMAHDFNNILGVAIGNLDLLEEQLGAQAGQHVLVTASLDALLRGAELTRALLAFSRRQPLRPTIIDVADLLGDTMKVLGRALGEQIEVEIHIEPHLWPTVADAAQLEAAITNLAINARDAMANGGGRLTIGARNLVLERDSMAETEPGDFVAIEVSDTGTGMTPEVLAHVFEPFYTTKPIGHGTGLGLSMVYGFVNQSGGHVRIYSEPGRGTTVRLLLPRAQAAATETPPQAETHRPEGGSETILVVDDNADVRRMVATQLTTLGYRVLLATHGQEALALLDGADPIDLLFTDVVMPHGLDGFELANLARKKFPGLPVLFTSGFPGTTAPLDEELGSGVHFIGKPYRRHDLAKAIRLAIDARKG